MTPEERDRLTRVEERLVRVEEKQGETLKRVEGIEEKLGEILRIVEKGRGARWAFGVVFSCVAAVVGGLWAIIK